jgi:hypothetical protein
MSIIFIPIFFAYTISNTYKYEQKKQIINSRHFPYFFVYILHYTYFICQIQLIFKI